MSLLLLLRARSTAANKTGSFSDTSGSTDATITDKVVVTGSETSGSTDAGVVSGRGAVRSDSSGVTDSLTYIKSATNNPVSTTDATAISVAESSSVIINAALPGTETSAISVVEVSSVMVSKSATDTAAITANEGGGSGGAASPPVFKSVSTRASGTGTAHTWNMATHAVGDLIFAVINRNHSSNAGFNPYTATPADQGWTVVEVGNDDGATPAGAHLGIWSKIATSSSETAPTATSTSSANWSTYTVVYSSVDSSTPFISEGGVAETGGTGTTVHSAPTQTNTDPNSIGIFVATNRQIASPASWSVSAPLTTRYTYDFGNANTTNILGVWADTGTTIATGDYTYQGTTSSGVAVAYMWTGILKGTAGSGGPAGQVTVITVPTTTNVNVVDSVDISVSDASSVFKDITSTDTASISINDISSNVANATIPGTESPAISVAEVSSVFVTQNRTDTTAISIADVSASSSTLSSTDTAAITIGDAGTLGGTSAISAADTAAISVFETRQTPDNLIFTDDFNRTPGIVATSASYTQPVQGSGYYGTDNATGWNATQNPSGLWRTDSANLVIVDGGGGNGLLTGDPTGWSGTVGWFRAHLTPNQLQLGATSNGYTISWRHKSGPFGLTVPGTISGGDATDLWIGYQSQYTLIAIQYHRQDNRIIAKRKVPTPGQSANNYGTYYNLKHHTDSPLAGNWVGSTATYANLPLATKNAIAAAEGRPWSDTLATDATNTGGTSYDFSVKVTLNGTKGLKIQLFRAGVLIGSWIDDFNVAADNYHCPLHNSFMTEYETHHTTANGHNDPPENWMRQPIGDHPGSSGFRSDNVQPWIDTYTIAGVNATTVQKSATDTASVSVAETSGTGTIGVPGIESTSVAITEVASIYVTQPTTDAAAISVADISTTNVLLSGSEIAAITIAETNTSFRQITVSESNGLGISDNSNLGSTAVPGSETTSVAVVETTSTSSTGSTTDTAAITIADISQPFITVSTTDTAAVSISDISNTGGTTGIPGAETVVVSVTDTSLVASTTSTVDTNSLSIAETRTLFVPVDTTDTASLAVADTTLATKTVDTTDTASITIVEIANSGSNTNVPGSETVAVSVTEARTISTTVTPVTDTAAVSVADVSTASITVNTTDTAAVSVADVSSSLRTFSVTDGASIAVGEVASNGGSATIPGSESTAVSVIEQTTIFVTRSTTDTGSITIVDGSNLSTSAGQTNVVANPSFETNTLNWTATSGATLTRALDATTPDGRYYGIITATGTANAIIMSPLYPTTAGTYWSAAAYMRLGTGVPHNTRVDIMFYDAAQVSLDSILSSNYTPTTTFTQIFNQGTTAADAVIAPVGTAYVRVRLAMLQPVAGDSIYVDAIQLEPSISVPAYNPQVVDTTSVPAADTGALVVSETSKVVVSKTTTDDSALSVSEFSAFVGNGGVIGSDQSAIMVSESASLVQSTSVTTNVQPNPSFEVDVSGYSVSSAEITRVSTDGAKDGSWYAQLLADGLGNIVMTGTWLPTTAGSIWSAGVYLKQFAVGGTRAGRIDVQFSDSSKTLITPTVMGSYVTLNSAWQQASILNRTAPTGTAYARVRIWITDPASGSAIPSDGDTFGVDAVQLEPTATLPPYNPDISNNLTPKSTTDTSSITIAESAGVIKSDAIRVTDTAALSVSELAQYSVVLVGGEAYSDTYSDFYESQQTLTNKSAADGLVIQLTESTSRVTAINSVDTAALGVVDVGSQGVNFTRTDTSALAVVEIVNPGTVPVGSDTAALAVVEQSFRSIVYGSDDTAAISVSETSTVFTGGISATERTALGVTESNSTLVGITRTDTAALTIVETTGSGNATISTTDTQGLRVTEASSIIILVDRVDAAVIAVNEVSAVSGDNPGFESVSLGITEEASILIKSTSTDSGSMSVSEVASRARVITSVDSANVSVTESTGTVLGKGTKVHVFYNGLFHTGQVWVFRNGAWRLGQVRVYKGGKWT